MSKRNVIILFSLLIVIALVVVFYFYKKDKSIPLPPPVIVDQETKNETMKKELMQFNKNPTSAKSDAEIKKDLKAFKAPTGEEAVSDEEMLRSLKDPSIQTN